MTALGHFKQWQGELIAQSDPLLSLPRTNAKVIAPQLPETGELF